jgi:hypothetical protein
MRVRVSLLNFTLDVNGNGSAFKVTDSSAIARVEAESLIRTGALLGFAARTVLTLPQILARTTRLTRLRKLLGEQRRELILIGWALHYRFLPKCNAKRANYEADSQLDWWRGHPDQ